MFLIGQKVICMQDNFSGKQVSQYKSLPFRHMTYYVRALHVNGEDILLVGIDNPLDQSGLELGYPAEYFAPIH